jgi:SAM-dependent methyltransferase
LPLHAPTVNGFVSGVSADCPICRRAVRSAFTVGGYRLFDCAACNYAFIDPQIASQLQTHALFDDAYFCSGGAGYANYFAEAELLHAHGTRYGALLRRAGARRVLDVGAAAGFILRGLIDAGCTGVGIEPNASMAAHARRDLGLDVRATTLEAFDSGEQFDAVALLQVVDHLEDIRRSFGRVRRLTKPGGWCLIEFGDRASLTARVLGKAWHEYAPPSVQRVFSLGALRLLMADFGFVLRASGHPAKYLRADHAVSLLRFKVEAPLVRAALDRLAGAIPPATRLRYPGDDITWALFEKCRGAQARSTDGARFVSAA